MKKNKMNQYEMYDKSMKKNPIDNLYCDNGIVIESELERLSRLEMATTMMTQVIPNKKKYKRKEKFKKDYKNESY